MTSKKTGKKQATILILEDDPILQEAYQVLLESEGHNIVLANNGEEGFVALEKHNPDLILLDLLMPIMDGMTFLKKLRKNGDKTTVVVLTNYDQDQQIEEAQTLGAHRYIVKAMAAPKDLAKMINHLIAKDL
jgi:CheY-like chemotaxis protein